MVYDRADEHRLWLKLKQEPASLAQLNSDLSLGRLFGDQRAYTTYVIHTAGPVAHDSLSFLQGKSDSICYITSIHTNMQRAPLSTSRNQRNHCIKER